MLPELPPKQNHVLVNHQFSKNCSVSVEQNTLSDHNGRLWISLEEKMTIKNKKTVYEVKHTDHKNIITMFRQQLGVTNICSFQQLINVIVKCKEASEYKISIKCHNNNVWINKELLDMMKQRHKAYKDKLLNSNDRVIEREFRNLKNKITNKIKILKANISGNNGRKLVETQGSNGNRLIAC
nr:unnamed protein product [Callosobruchus analis]